MELDVTLRKTMLLPVMLRSWRRCLLLPEMGVLVYVRLAA